MTMTTKLITCEQCSVYFWATRSTRKFCSGKCRQRHNRGKEKVAWWNIEQHEDIVYAQNEHFLSVVLDGNPKLAKRLTAYRDRYGGKALNELIAINRTLLSSPLE